MTDQTMIPTWPKIEALTRPDGSGEITINGTSWQIDTNTAAAARREILRRVVETATKMGRPVRVTTSGPDGNWPIIVHPDGAIEPDASLPAAPARAKSTLPAASTSPSNQAGPVVDAVQAPDPQPPTIIQEPPVPTQPSTTSQQPPPPPAQPQGAAAYATDELLQQLRPQAAVKAQTGWRALLGLGPSKRERLLIADQTAVRTAFPRAVTVMVANPKGGGGKTPTSLILAGEMGNARGGGVVVWDNNELRGNARDRSYFPHARSVADLLAAADTLERPDASFTELSYYLAHQTQGKYFVLSSDSAGRAVMDQDQVRRVHRLLARFFQVIIIDTGNNEKAPNWLAARDLADCLVVPMKWRQDSILVANRMLATMAEEGNPLLQRAVLVGTNGPGDFQRDARAAVYARFSKAHHITEIGTDPHIHAGAIIDRRQLTARTQRAGLETAAIVARLCADSTQQ